MAPSSPPKRPPFGLSIGAPSRWIWGVLIITLIGFLLRVYGLRLGLPNAHRYFSYHPDEGLNLAAAIRADILHGQLDTHFYHYGTLYFYLVSFALSLARGWGFLHHLPAGMVIPASYYLVARWVTVLMGTATIALVYGLGRRLYGEMAGLLAAAGAAITPLAVVHSHFATVDVPAAFFVVAALYSGAGLLHKPTIKGYLKCGLLTGLAGATKYNAALVVLGPALVWLTGAGAPNAGQPTNTDDAQPIPGNKPIKRNLIHLLVLLFAALAGFLIGCPGPLINWHGFYRDFTYELTKSQQGMGLLFVKTGNGWWYHFAVSLRYGMGIPLLLVCTAGVGMALARRSRADLLLLGFLIPYYGVIGWAQVRFMRYVIPILPVLIVMGARLLTEPFPKMPRMNRILQAIGVLVALQAGFLCLALDHQFGAPDARGVAARWLEKNAPPGATVGFATTPWYYTPPLSPWFGAPPWTVRREAAQEMSRFQAVLPPLDRNGYPTEWNLAVLDQKPQYVIISNLESEDPIRLRLPDAMAFYHQLNRDYRPVVFANVPEAVGLQLRVPAYLPNDLLYILPKITIYVRR